MADENEAALDGPPADDGSNGPSQAGNDKPQDDIKINRYPTGPPRGRGYGPRGPR